MRARAYYKIRRFNIRRNIWLWTANNTAWKQNRKVRTVLWESRPFNKTPIKDRIERIYKIKFPHAIRVATYFSGDVLRYNGIGKPWLLIRKGRTSSLKK